MSVRKLLEKGWLGWELMVGDEGREVHPQDGCRAKGGLRRRVMYTDD